MNSHAMRNSLHLGREKHHNHPAGKLKTHTKSLGIAHVSYFLLLQWYFLPCLPNSIFTCVWSSWVSILLRNGHLGTFLTSTVLFLISTFTGFSEILSLGFSFIHLSLLTVSELPLPPLPLSSPAAHPPGQMSLFFFSILFAFAASTIFLTSVPFATKFLNPCLRCLITGSFSNSALGATNGWDRLPCCWSFQNSPSSCFSFPGCPLCLLRCWVFLFIILKLFLWLLPYSLTHEAGFTFSHLDALFLSLPICPLSHLLPPLRPLPPVGWQEGCRAH